MRIDFNNVRKQALHAYDNLAKELNANIFKKDEYVQTDGGRYINLNGCVVVDVDNIQRQMDDLRQLIGAIASTYNEGDDDVQDVYSQVYPKGQSMVLFNDGEDEG